MTQISGRKPQIDPANYLYHLPDKPFPTGKVSYEEFLDWLDEDTLAEWVDGEIEMSSPASIEHQDIKGFLESSLRLFSEAFELGRVFSAGLQMKLAASGREPDLIFVAEEHLNRLQPNSINGPGDLVIEIVSPESQKRDRETKFAEYAVGNVPEYWLIDPVAQEAIFYQLDQNGQYQPMPLDSEGKYYSRAVAGFWLKAAWLWQEPLPKVDQLLLEIGGPAYANYLISKLQQGGFLSPPTT